MEEKINIFLLIGLLVLSSTMTITISAETTTILLNDPPYEPSDPNPEDGAIDIGINTHLRWTGGDPDQGDKVTYDVYFGTTQTPLLVIQNLSNPTYDPGDLQFETTYYWKVISTDKQDATTEGTVWSFTTEQCANDPPNKPDTPSGPTRTRNRYAYEYCTRSSDPNNDGLYYNWSWGDGNYSGWMGPYENRERCWAQYNWSEPGSYQVRVKAMDGPRNETITTLGILYFDESDWSDPLTVTVTLDEPTNTAPNNPQINGETNGKAGNSYTYTITSVDNDADDLYYSIEWGDTTDIEYLGPYHSGEIIIVDHSWNIQGEYTIRVKATDVFDAESQWISLEISMPHTIEKPRPGGNGLMQRLRNQICDMMGICQGGIILETIEGTLTFDGTNFYIGEVELHFGPIWYITTAISSYDYDGDGTEETIYDELQGLVGSQITVEGHMQSDNWLSVFSINGITYREPGQAIWAWQHQYRWRHGPNKP